MARWVPWAVSRPCRERACRTNASSRTNAEHKSPREQQLSSPPWRGSSNHGGWQLARSRRSRRGAKSNRLHRNCGCLLDPRACGDDSCCFRRANDLDNRQRRLCKCASPLRRRLTPRRGPTGPAAPRSSRPAPGCRRGVRRSARGSSPSRRASARCRLLARSPRRTRTS